MIHADPSKHAALSSEILGQLETMKKKNSHFENGGGISWTENDIHIHAVTRNILECGGVGTDTPSSRQRGLFSY